MLKWVTYVGDILFSFLRIDNYVECPVLNPIYWASIGLCLGISFVVSRRTWRPSG